MARTLRFTTADLELLPDDGTRYEIIDGELYGAKASHAYHQMTCFEIASALADWDRRAKGRPF
jgi:Uma2 family endonuclease